MPDPIAPVLERMAKLRAHLKTADVAGILLSDPVNIFYACASSNMPVWTMHNAVRYVFVATESACVVFDFHGCGHLNAHSEVITEVRPAKGTYFMGAGANAPEITALWAAEIADLVRAHGGGSTRLATDHLDVFAGLALQAQGLSLVEGQAIVETARLIKTNDEVLAMRAAIAAAEAGMWKMREVLEPGITENELWSHLHQQNIAHGGQWIETRLLSAGPRTNPWFHECSDYVIQAGDMVAFDTDMVGPYMMCADISRTYVCGDRPSQEQTRLYALAVEQIEHNLNLLKPGMAISEWGEKGYQLPDDCLPNRYSVVFHGVGICDEYPSCYYREDATHAYDLVIEPDMCLCFESYVGEVGGKEGVKLERQVRVTETGWEYLDSFPYEEKMLPGRWL